MRDMFERMMYLAVFTMYTALLGALLVFYDSNAITVAIVLSIIPALVIWRLESLRSYILPIVLLVTLGVSLVLEVIAYLNGIWYEISPWGVRVFGLVPAEALLATFAHVLFLIVAYEFWFDDQKTSGAHPVHLSYGLALSGVLLALALAYVYVFSGIFFVYSYALLIMVVFAVFFVAVALTHRASWRLLRKATYFALALYPASLLYEYVVLTNDLRFLANTSEYLSTCTFFDLSLQLEELIFILVIPFWVAILYELYLDDAK